MRTATINLLAVIVFAALPWLAANATPIGEFQLTGNGVATTPVTFDFAIRSWDDATGLAWGQASDSISHLEFVPTATAKLDDSDPSMLRLINLRLDLGSASVSGLLDSGLAYTLDLSSLYFGFVFGEGNSGPPLGESLAPGVPTTLTGRIFAEGYGTLTIDGAAIDYHLVAPCCFSRVEAEWYPAGVDLGLGVSSVDRIRVSAPSDTRVSVRTGISGPVGVYSATIYADLGGWSEELAEVPRPIPEPSTALFFGLGLAALAAHRPN